MLSYAPWSLNLRLALSRSWLSVVRPTRFSSKFLGCLYGGLLTHRLQVVKSRWLAFIRFSRFRCSQESSLSDVLSPNAWVLRCATRGLSGGERGLTGLSPRSSFDDTIMIAQSTGDCKGFYMIFIRFGVIYKQGLADLCKLYSRQSGDALSVSGRSGTLWDWWTVGQAHRERTKVLFTHTGTWLVHSHT